MSYDGNVHGAFGQNAVCSKKARELMQISPPTFPPWGQPLYSGVFYTADDVERLPDDSYRYEVYQRVLIRMPGTGPEHGLICQYIGRLLEGYWRSRGEMYRVLQNVGYDFTSPGDPPRTLMLVPDVAVTRDNVRPGPEIEQIPPLVAIEVASPSDYRPGMESRATFYLTHGVQEVWNVWPRSRTVDIWTAPGTVMTMNDQQNITSVLLPGWSCPVQQCFDG